MTTTEPLRAGDTVHVLAAATICFEGGLFGRSEVVGRGATLVLTSTMLEQNEDRRTGRSVFDLATDPEEQERRWGKVLYAPGPWPDNEPTWRYGDQAWAEGRANAIAAAWDLRDEQARTDALAAARATFGPALTSKTTTVLRTG
ncbi:hypothetical protein [Curtobacterium sp. MCLR17_044]|uniref:hypothetical protein n=1 Tax=Curtobacterium sp. MCLR17_044 TaxID=2175628 RepID=UPI0011B85302|nr:hypothetical protein [Curtobacterium sp. MCLR17_044]